MTSLVSTCGEFLPALLLAHSVSAQADAIHGLVHLSLYSVALWVSRQVLIRNMDAHAEYHYREKFTAIYMPLIFVSLAWVAYASVAKFFSPENVATNYMLTSVSIGICGNIICLRILASIWRIQGNAPHKGKAHRLLSWDALGDSLFSAIVLATALAGLKFPQLPIHFIDPVVSLGGIAWISWLCMRVLREKTPHHSH